MASVRICCVHRKLMALNFEQTSANFDRPEQASRAFRLLIGSECALRNFVSARKNFGGNGLHRTAFNEHGVTNRIGLNDEWSHRHMSVTQKTLTYSMRTTCQPLECFNLPCFRVKPLHTTVFRTESTPDRRHSVFPRSQSSQRSLCTEFSAWVFVT